METTALRRILIFIGILILILGIPVLAAYTAGYRIDRSLRVYAPSSITLSNLEPGLEIYIDGKPRGTIASTTEMRYRFLPEGVHEVLVAKKGSWPWMKSLPIRGGEELVVAPFSIAVSPVTTDYLPAYSQYSVLVNLFKGVSIPSKDSPRISLDDSVSVWIEGETIYASWRGTSTPATAFCTPNCASQITVFSGRSPITQADFFKGRNDVILFAMDESVYAIEIDKRDRQNFQPVYKGVKPNFILNGTNAIYVHDQDRYTEITL